MESVIYLINEYGIYFIFILITIEYACFPVPSEVVLPLAGAIGYVNNINPLLMILIASICGYIGSCFCYFLGYFGKTKIMNRLTRNKDKEVNESKSFYSKYANIAICGGRIIPICRTYISFIAGANKHKFLSYSFFSIIGIIIWNATLITLGYLFYDNIDIIKPFYDTYKYIILSIILIVIFIILYKKIKAKHITKSTKKISH